MTSLIEPRVEPKGECKTCKKADQCSAWWRKDVEERHAICVQKPYSRRDLEG